MHVHKVKWCDLSDQVIGPDCCWCFMLQIGVNAKNPIIVGPVLTVDTFVATFMPAYLILEAGRVGHLGDDSEGPTEKESGRPISQGALQSA